MELSDKVKAAIRADARDSQAEAREKHADNPVTLAQIDSMEDMLYDLTLRQYEGGYHNRLLSAVWHEALDAVQEQINQNVPLTRETVLYLENPYAPKTKD
ncbi:hypothetical protein SEA_BIG4_49 [Microbacterium phage Big4]|nr:hypothetical protein SEA_BIG4_49 [Microbacterium phage Big4]